MTPRKALPRALRGVLCALFWVAVWQAAAMAVGKPVVLASPAETVRALLRLLPQAEFLRSAGGSFLRIAGGFFLALALGLLCGVLSRRFALLRALLAPLVSFMKSVPVASFVVLALVWFGSARLSLVVVLLVVFPPVYFAVLAGLDAADAQLLEMAAVFRVPRLRTALEIYRPAAAPYLEAACETALGMSWKAGVAAEVIGTPLHSIGAQLYNAKVYFDTASLFAWTLVIIALSAVFEKAVLALLRKAGGTHGH